MLTSIQVFHESIFIICLCNLQIYDALGSRRAAALINWHALKGCDTTCHFRWKGKATSFNTFMAVGPKVTSTLSKPGIGNEPTTEGIEGSGKFLCLLFCPKEIQFLKLITWDGTCSNTLSQNREWTNYHLHQGHGSNTYSGHILKQTFGPRTSLKIQCL